MYSAAVFFLTSSVDLFHRQAAGQWGAARQGSLGFASKDTFNLQVSICLSQPSRSQPFYTPSLPPAARKGCFLNPHIIICFRCLDGHPNFERDSQTLILQQSLHLQLGYREKIKLWWRGVGVGLPDPWGQLPDILKLALKI